MEELAAVAAMVLEQSTGLPVQETVKLPIPSAMEMLRGADGIAIPIDSQLNFPARPIRSLTQQEAKRIRRTFKGIAARTREYREIRDKICTELGITPRQIGGTLNKNRH